MLHSRQRFRFKLQSQLQGSRLGENCWSDFDFANNVNYYVKNNQELRLVDVDGNGMPRCLTKYGSYTIYSLGLTLNVDGAQADGVPP